MITREKLLESLQDLPEEFTFEEVMDRIVLLEKVEKGTEQSFAGKTYSTKEAKDKLGKWLR